MTAYTASIAQAVAGGNDSPQRHLPTGSDIDHAAVARALYLDRRERARLFDNALFGEPAWDILLDLRGRYEGEDMPSSLSICAGADSPSSTGLRYIRALEKAGLVERSNDPGDGRRRVARLSDKGVKLIDRYIDLILKRRSKQRLPQC